MSHDISKPLFAYVAWHAVHDPLQAPEKYIKLYDKIIQDQSRKTLAAMITNLDDGIYNISAALKRRGMWNNTVIIFTT